MLRPIALLVLVASLAPANVFASDHHHHHHSSHHHHSGHHSSGSGGGCSAHADDDDDADDETTNATPSPSPSASSSATSPGPSPTPTPSATPTPTGRMRVFVTRETFTADLGGLAGADALCQAAAKDAGLSGSFRAWLSSAPASADAFARLTGDGPWYTVGGVTAFGDRPDRFGPPMTDLADETGHLPTQPDGGSWSVWSGSDANGRRDGLDCAGWTSASSTERGAVGNAQADDVEWGGGHVNVACSTRASLVCFQQ